MMMLYVYATGEPLRELTAAEVDLFMRSICDLAEPHPVPGAKFGYPGVGVYAL